MKKFFAVVLFVLLAVPFAYSADVSISAQTELAAAPAEADLVPIYDADAAAGKRITILNLFKALESALTGFAIHQDNLPSTLTGTFNIGAGTVSLVGTTATGTIQRYAPVQKLAVFSFSGGGSDIPDNSKVDSYIPTAGTITGVIMTASDASACSAVIDIWSQAYADFPPEAAQKITASAPPTLTTALMSKDTTLTGWTTALAADRILRANVTSNDCTGTVTVSLIGTTP